jgi:ribosome recycling factor
MIVLNRDSYKPYEDRMNKTLNVLREEFHAIRAGRANPHVLDKIAIEYYGTKTPIQQVANIQVPEARIIMITPWDPTTLKEIVKSINMSDLGINPNNDGKSIRLVFPALTEERRKDLVKQVHRLAEEARIAIRNLRREGVDHFKDLQKKHEMTEDALDEAEKEMQKLTDHYIAEIDKQVCDKEKDLMEV